MCNKCRHSAVVVFFKILQDSDLSLTTDLTECQHLYLSDQSSEKGLCSMLQHCNLFLDSKGMGLIFRQQ